jgi:hypothetical protein
VCRRSRRLRQWSIFPGKKKLNAHAHTLVATILALMYYIYLFITKTSLDIFNCSTVAAADGTIYDETKYLAVDPSIPCYTKGSVQVG